MEGLLSDGGRCRALSRAGLALTYVLKETSWMLCGEA